MFATGKRPPISCRRASVAFEYVIVTLIGLGMSLVMMKFAQKMLQEKIETMKEEMEASFPKQGDFGEWEGGGDF